MGVAEGSRPGSARIARLLAATALTCVLGGLALSQPAFSQAIEGLTPVVDDGSPMLIEADTLIYDNNDDTVTASGGVKIDYGGNRLVADSVTYDRDTRRLIASGGVQIVDKDGNKVFSDTIDVTDDFGDGFVNALRVETVDKTYFAAESAERRGGFLTTFNNGVYTACEPCEEKPDKAPIWRIKAKRIIWNQKAKTVRFEQSSFEFFGIPLGSYPAFEIPDPSVKRKTGFLLPSGKYKSDLGFGMAVPYYIALAPTYDLTITGTGYSKQGFLGEAEYRQRFDNGEFSVKVAGIYQIDPGAFDSDTVDAQQNFRGMMGTKGNFALNSRWDFGWDILAQTDKNFSNTYDIDGYDDYVQQSQVYLTGLHDRNYFDLRAMHFDVQEEALDSDPDSRDDKQPWVLPTFDYSYTPDEPLFGGELNIDVNAHVIRRTTLDDTWSDDFPNIERVRGIDGTTSRVTAAAEWKRSLITESGLVVTPLLAFQADTVHVDQTAASVMAINSMASNPQIDAPSDTRSLYNRIMATAGLELRFPLLFLSQNSSHVLEPMAQLFARPDGAYNDSLGIPNEDAQSFVFDATTLFERDKFSGYDRIEGGTRANIGLRYSGVYEGGWTMNAIAGQSYQIGGENPFAAPDLVNAGAYSGLESERSDFVGLFGLAAPNGISASVSARLDEQSLEVRRAEFKAGYSTDQTSLSAKFAYIQAQPLYGYDYDRHEISLAASQRFNENWRIFGSGTYDFHSDLLVRDSLGFAYDDECFTYLMTVSENRDIGTRELTRRVGFNLTFRTIGDFGTSTSVPSSL